MSDETVTCVICGREMRLISPAHLKTHELTTLEYKRRFPEAEIISLASSRRKSKNISDKKIGKPSRLKGIPKTEEHRRKISEIKKLNFTSGKTVHWNLGKQVSEESKAKSRASMLKITKSPTYKNPMRDKRLSEKARQKISASQENRVNRQLKQTIERISGHLSHFNLEVLSRRGNEYELKCLTCLTEFTRTTSVLSQYQYDNHDGKYCPTCFPPVNSGYYSEVLFKEKPHIKIMSGYFYVVEMSDEFEKFIKVGMTSSSAKQRWKHFTAYNIKILLEIKTTLYEAFCLERKILNDLKSMKLVPNKKFGGMFECLRLDAAGSILSKLNEAGGAPYCYV